MPLTTLDERELQNWLRETAAYSWTFDADGRALDCDFWTTLTGQSLKDAPKIWQEALHPDDRERVRAAWNTAFVHGQPYNIDLRIRGIDGIHRWFNARAAPMRSTEGTIVRWVGITLRLNDVPINGRGGPVAIAAATTAADTATMPAAIARAARAMLDWSAEELSNRSGVSISTIRRLERDDSNGGARRTSAERLRRAYTAAGIGFTSDGGTIIGVRWSRDRN